MINQKEIPKTSNESINDQESQETDPKPKGVFTLKGSLSAISNDKTSEKKTEVKPPTFKFVAPKPASTQN